MNLLPPSLAYIKIKEESKKGLGFWIPIFLLWPLIFIIFLLIFTVTFIVDFLLLLGGRKYHHYTVLAASILNLFWEIRGTNINVEGKDSAVKIKMI